LKWKNVVNTIESEIDLTLRCSLVISDRKIFCFEILKITASSECYETLWLLWHYVCEHTKKL